MSWRPASRLVLATGAWAVTALAPALWPPLAPWWQAATLLLVAAAVSDLLALRARALPTVTRQVAHNLPLGEWSPVHLTVTPRDDRALALTLYDHHPSRFAAEGMPVTLTLAGEALHITYRVLPPRRGDERFEAAEVALHSPWRLWRRRLRLGPGQAVRVFPNFAEIAHYTLLATDNRLSQLGIRHQRRRGQGSDFHQLREYRQGDSLRQIDWKATSRYRRLISREYQDARDQQVLFLLDCGYRMRHEDGERIHLDQALNAMLLLAYVALRQGDAVGLMSFGGERRWFAPRKGHHVINTLLEGTYDLAATMEAPDFRGVAAETAALQRRRALVVMLTNTRDEELGELEAAVKILQRRHLTVVANLREAVLDEISHTPVTDFPAALRFHTGLEYLSERGRALARLRRHGAHLLDLPPPALPPALVNQYLDIKRRASL